MVIIFVVISLVLVKQTSGVIYHVNESEYHKMPPLYALDDYSECLLQPQGLYCVADYHLFSNAHSDLMHFIQEYSAFKMKHFNYTLIHRGTCVSISCKDYIHRINETGNLEMILGECLNESLWRSHKLEASLAELKYCKSAEDKTILDLSDFLVAAVYVILITLNIIGSFYDVMLCEKDSKTGNPYLLSFSMRRNWSKLIAPGGSGPDPRMERLKLFNGLRTMTLACVIFSHSALIASITYIANPRYIEQIYDDLSKQMLLNGNLVTHTFFVMSSFLLAYNLQIQSEKTEITWKHIPKGILLRWIRLTPSYALVIATISTWMRYIGSGPMWDLIVVSEANYCRHYWWANIFYFNNYIYKYDICFPQGWYLAADTQMFCLGLILLVLVQKPQHRKVALVLLFLLSLLISAANTYFQDLTAVISQSPESARTLYVDEDTFTLSYIRGHTNLSTYTLGLAGGILTYYWQTNGKDFTKYKKYRWLVWLMFPLGVGIILSGGMFFTDHAAPSTLLRVGYAALSKPTFQLLILVLIISTIFKIETVYRGIIEWRGFAWAGRVSYSAFLLHTLFQRGVVGYQTTPLYLTDYFIFIVLCASIFLSFSLGTVLWLTVEAPIGGLTRALLAPRNKNKP
ncbi:nose resistant to fluoxetine protein 6-like [Bicyclus anynana]|uniref:Nose resistant to fluoxetine protein 6-like n=1 Tax=Bicyclus anynana TaxID=110368 RepID=A0A6J1MUB7_BICAN|nr:nose resistant to fluoxetine protein 6-like [Bicyclus anynana]